MQQGPEEKTILQDVPWPDEPPVMLPGKPSACNRHHRRRRVDPAHRNGLDVRALHRGHVRGAAADRGRPTCSSSASASGASTSRWLGLCHHQFRVVDRYRPRRHAHLRNSVAAEAELAQLHQPLRRSHDAVRRGLRRHVPAAAHGPSLAGILDVPLSQQHGRVAAVPQPAGVGRVRGVDLRHDLGCVLVCRPGA